MLPAYLRDRQHLRLHHLATKLQGTVKYVWYKLESHYGAGHQGTEIRYFYSTGELDKSTREEIEHEEAFSLASRYDTGCITRLRKVQSVPPEEIEKLRSNAKRTIRNSRALLKALDELENG